jgi:AcrR family transcriptional regulator
VRRGAAETAADDATPAGTTPEAATTEATTSRASAGDAAPDDRSQRARILAAATELMATHGVRGMTMRQLAAACGLTIATLYHYFGSKSDLLAAIVAERRYDAGLRRLTPDVDPGLPPRGRLAAFVADLTAQALGELRLWRLLIGESLRDDAVALAEARRLAGLLEEAIGARLRELFPELGPDRPGPSPAHVTAVVTGQLLALFLQELLLGDEGRADRIGQAAEATAAVVFPDPT